MKNALKLKIIKPKDVSWNELGLVLHAQRLVMGQLLQAGVDTIAACRVAGGDRVKEAIAPNAKCKAIAESLVYQGVKRELEKICESNSWTEEQKAALNFSMDIVSGIGRRAHQDYKAWQQAQYEKGKGPPATRMGRRTYGKPQPIAVPKVNWSIELEDKDLVLTFKTLSKGHFKVIAQRFYGARWQVVNAMAKGKMEDLRGDCKLVYDRTKKEWFAIISYSEEPPAKLPTGGVLVVHRGMRQMLTVMTDAGHYKVVAYGHAFLKQRRRLKQMNKKIQETTWAERGARVRGRGRKRRYGEKEGRDAKLARIIKTYCEQLAARVVKLALIWRCSDIVIEEYGGIKPDEDRDIRRFLDHFPYYQLKQAILRECAQHGLAVREVPAQYISTTCPACDRSDERYHNKRTGIFHCDCGHSRDVDYVACFHMLASSGADISKLKKRLSGDVLPPAKPPQAAG